MPTRDAPRPFDETTILLWAARRTGVLEALLTSADTASEVAAETGVTERAARVTVDALAAEGFLDRVDGAYEPTNRALGFLAKTDLRSIGHLPRRLDLLDAYAALPETMRSDGPLSLAETRPSVPDEEVRTRNRLGAIAAADEATVRALATAALRPAPDADSVLMVGGAPGVLAGEFAVRGRDVTVYDAPSAVAASESLLAPTDLDLASGSLTGPYVEAVEDAERAEVDLVVAPDLCWRLGPDEVSRFATNAVDALATDGTLVVLDRLRDRSAGATAAAVEALATTDRGRPHASEEYREWLGAAGVVDVSVADVPGTDRVAVVGSPSDGRSPE